MNAEPIATPPDSADARSGGRWWARPLWRPAICLTISLLAFGIAGGVMAVTGDEMPSAVSVGLAVGGALVLYIVNAAKQDTSDEGQRVALAWSAELIAAASIGAALWSAVGELDGVGTFIIVTVAVLVTFVVFFGLVSRLLTPAGHSGTESTLEAAATCMSAAPGQLPPSESIPGLSTSEAQPLEARPRSEGDQQ